MSDDKLLHDCVISKYRGTPIQKFNNGRILVWMSRNTDQQGRIVGRIPIECDSLEEAKEYIDKKVAQQ